MPFTLRIVGEDKTLSIKVGAKAGDELTEDIILVRGASAEVQRAVKEILMIVENAKNDEIVNSYVRRIIIELWPQLMSFVVH